MWFRAFLEQVVPQILSLESFDYLEQVNTSVVKKERRPDTNFILIKSQYPEETQPPIK